MKILYFGIYNPEFGRNKVYISGLKENGHEVIECRDTTKGIGKFFGLWKKHRDVKSYDVMIVGYPGHIVVPFAKLISRGPVVFDALCTLYEGEVISRGKYKGNVFMIFWIRLIDRLAVTFADLILVETNSQRDYFLKRFSLQEKKVVRVFTGADTEFLYKDESVKKHSRFTVFFRGKFLPEAGVEHIIKAAKILENKEVDFLIIGNGFLEKEIKVMISQYAPKNLTLISENKSWPELRTKMLECHASLGQFEKHERLDRTIPHKAFETLALGLPYITGRTKAVSELLTDGKNCLMVNCADPDDLANKILILKNDSEMTRNIANNGYKLFSEKLIPRKLAEELVSSIRTNLTVV